MKFRLGKRGAAPLAAGAEVGAASSTASAQTLAGGAGGAGAGAGSGMMGYLLVGFILFMIISSICNKEDRKKFIKECNNKEGVLCQTQQCTSQIKLEDKKESGGLGCEGKGKAPGGMVCCKAAACTNATQPNLTTTKPLSGIVPPTDTSGLERSGLRSCAENRGAICLRHEYCKVSFFSANDSGRCCPQEAGCQTRIFTTTTFTTIVSGSATVEKINDEPTYGVWWGNNTGSSDFDVKLATPVLSHPQFASVRLVTGSNATYSFEAQDINGVQQPYSFRVEDKSTSISVTEVH